MAGTVAYWTRTRARRHHDPKTAPPHVVTSPVTLDNKSRDPLLIEKIHLRLPHLSVYEHEGTLWTDTSYIAFKGVGEYETVQEKGEPSSECPEAALRTGPRTPPRTGLAALSFSPLKALTELDF